MTESESESAVPKRGKLCFLVLILAVLWTGAYCCQLNLRLYQHHHPVFDSMSYNEKLFRVMTVAQDKGFVESLRIACFENNTNCLPFLVAAVISPIASPSRLVGVGIQTGLLLLFLSSLYLYLLRYRSLRPASALAICLVYLGAKCIFFENGGLSDFRMDLSLFLSFGMTCVWYLASMAAPSRRNFVLLGVSAAISCLFRATAPVYLLFALGPLFVIEILFGSDRKSKLIGGLISIAVVALLAGWFFVLNFEFLKFYYVDWNTDANAKIPWAEAYRHWPLAQRSVGEPIFLLFLLWGIAGLVVTRKTDSVRGWMSIAWKQREIDWRIAWLAIAPAAMLIARRAGLNPFVVMPSVFGLVLVFALPLISQVNRLNDRHLNRFCWIVLLVLVSFSCVRAWNRHSLRGFNTMAAQQSLIDRMIEDANDSGLDEIRFGAVHLTDVNTKGLYSILLFDRPNATPELDGVIEGSLKFIPDYTFVQPAAHDWNQLKGDTDAEKNQFMLANANIHCNYLILPDQASAVHIEETVSQNFINRQLTEIRAMMLAEDSWTKVGDAVRTDPDEVVELYRRVK